MIKPTSTDAYIASFPQAIQEKLQLVRAAIKKAAPEAEEYISYGMPAFKHSGSLVYFAAFANHIGLYALPSGNAAFKKQLKAYKVGKGSIQFPHNAPLPINLIEQIVQFRVKENMVKKQAKNNKASLSLIKK